MVSFGACNTFEHTESLNFIAVACTRRTLLIHCALPFSMQLPSKVSWFILLHKRSAEIQEVGDGMANQWLFPSVLALEDFGSWTNMKKLELGNSGTFIAFSLRAFTAFNYFRGKRGIQNNVTSMGDTWDAEQAWRDAIKRNPRKAVMRSYSARSLRLSLSVTLQKKSDLNFITCHGKPANNAELIWTVHTMIT